MDHRFPALALAFLLPGCIADDTPPPSIVAPPIVGPEPIEPASANATLLTFEGNLPLSVGTPLVSGNPNAAEDDFLFRFDIPEGTGDVIVTMTWNATQSTSQALVVLVETDADAPTEIGHGDGVSPLVVTFAGADHVGALRTRTFASGSGGLAKDQPFTIGVSWVPAPVK